MSKHKTEVSLSKETEDTIKDLVKHAQINADRSHKQMIWVTICIGIMMACATLISAN